MLFAATALTILIWESVLNVELDWTSPSVRATSVAAFHCYRPAAHRSVELSL